MVSLDWWSSLLLHMWKNSLCVCVQWQTSTNTGCVCCSLLNKLTYSYHFQLSLISSVAFVSIVSMSQAVKYNNSSETSKSYILLEFKVEQRKWDREWERIHLLLWFSKYFVASISYFSFNTRMCVPLRLYLSVAYSVTLWWASRILRYSALHGIWVLGTILVKFSWVI